MKIYLAGGLFSEVQIAGRWLEYYRAMEVFPHAEIFSPIAADYNQDKTVDLPTPKDIYWGDYHQISTSDYVIFDMGDHLDPGMNLELGIIAGLNQERAGKIIPIAVYSDIRLPAANKYNIPSVGYNHMVVGCIDTYGYSVYSFEEALALIEEQNNLMIQNW